MNIPTLLWGQTGGEEQLQDIVRKGESDYGLLRRVNHQHGGPKALKAEGETQVGGLMEWGEKHKHIMLTHTTQAHYSKT